MTYQVNKNNPISLITYFLDVLNTDIPLKTEQTLKIMNEDGEKSEEMRHEFIKHTKILVHKGLLKIPKRFVNNYSRALWFRAKRNIYSNNWGRKTQPTKW